MRPVCAVEFLTRVAQVPRRLFVAAVLASMTPLLVANCSRATAAGPFYLVPSATTECQGIKNCLGSKGPWVVVPASGEATYLFGCPQHIGFIVAGTDARTSSTNIRVWFSNEIGGRIGPASNPKGAAVILFHAASNNARAGWFQPLVGCVSLIAKNKRSTVSARDAGRPSAPVDLRAETLVPKPTAELGEQTKGLACPKGERPVASWSAFSLYTSNPPNPSFEHAMTIRTVISGGRVIGRFRLNRLFSILAPRFYVQIGAECEP